MGRDRISGRTCARLWRQGLGVRTRRVPSGSPSSASEDGIEADRRHEHDADDDVLDRGVDLQEGHARLERLHEDGAEDRTRDGPDAACERRAADDHRGDDRQLRPDAEADDRRLEAGDRDRAADRPRGCP